jgi:guanylate kinase
MSSKVLGNLEKGLIFVVSAPGGTGKTTLIEKLQEEFPCVVKSVSFTTRQPRQGEITGKDYHFITEAEFTAKKERGDFLEWVKLYGNYYGTSHSWIEEQQNLGKHVVLVIDTQGASVIRRHLSAVYIFICPPDMDELRKRLNGRQTDNEIEIEKRLKRAKEEIEAGKKYDYQIVNDDLFTAYMVLKSIFVAEEHRTRI